MEGETQSTQTSQQKGSNKMMFIIVAVIAVLAIGGFMFFANQSQTETQPAIEESMTSEDSMMEGTSQESTSMEGEGMTQGEVKTFEVSGKNFSFTPNQISVKKGDTVKIVFTNAGGTHDLVVDGYDVRTDVTSSGQTDEIEFVANEVGQFEFYCSVGNHRQMGMVGMLTVTE